VADENNVENLILHQLRAIDAKMDRRFDETGKQIVEAFEKVYAEIAEVKAEVLRCREDVAGADLSSKQVAVRLTLLEKRVKNLEEARPDA
jgi:predicted  nucleic acid-binding Zn-ribbon protein